MVGFSIRFEDDNNHRDEERKERKIYVQFLGWVKI